MAEAITGTPTQKSDQMAQELVSLKATVRLHNWLFGCLLVLMLGAVYTGIQVQAELRVVSTELKAMNSRLDRIEENQRETQKELKDQRERLIKLESRVDHKP